MDQRNMLYSNHHMTDFEADQQTQDHLHPEPNILLGSMSNFPQPNIPNILPPPGNIPCFDFPRFLEQDVTAFYRTHQYSHQICPITNLEPAVPAPDTPFYPYLNHGSRMFSASMSYGSRDHLPSSSSFQDGVIDGNGYGRNNGFRGSGKRNISERTLGNAHYGFSPSSETGSSMPSVNGFQFDDGVLVMDASYPMPEYGGSYAGPPFGLPVPAWSDHPSNGVSRDPSTLPFNQPPLAPYFEYDAATNISRVSLENDNGAGQRFHEGAGTASGASNMLNSAPLIHHQRDFYPSQTFQGASRYDVNHCPPITSTISRLPHTHDNVLQHGPSSAVLPPTGFRIYRSHRRGMLPEGVQRHQNLPQFRIVPGEGTAVLEFPGYNELRNMTDHHQDMRLDIDYMSYEELLALGERIGSVNTGLSEETIEAHLRTRVHESSIAKINLEEVPSIDDRDDSCVICQEEYVKGDGVGTLDCGHEYHVNCIRKWLPVKNACPICKLVALNVEGKDA